jgi:hypothetical protein
MKYQYIKEVEMKIQLINSLLNDINENPLFENDTLIVDDSKNFEHYVQFTSSKENSIKVAIVCSKDAIQINLDRTVETFELNNEILFTKEYESRNEILKILTCSVEVVYCGKNYTDFLFFEKNVILKNIKIISGLYLKINCTKKFYEPLFKKT